MGNMFLGGHQESRLLVELYPGDYFMKDGQLYIFFNDEKGVIGGVNINDGTVFYDDKVTEVLVSVYNA